MRETGAERGDGLVILGITGDLARVMRCRSWLFVQETKGRSLEETQQGWVVGGDRMLEGEGTA